MTVTTECISYRKPLLCFMSTNAINKYSRLVAALTRQSEHKQCQVFPVVSMLLIQLEFFFSYLI